MAAPRRCSPPSRFVVASALGLFVLASRAWLIGAGGSVVPYWDQWEVEALSLYPKWLDGTLSWMDMFAPHNEHRIALTRLADLALFIAAGGWNPWAQMLFNAVLHALTGAGLALLFWPALRRAGQSLWVAAMAVLFSSTCGWQNALWGFQSQVYFANVLTVAAIAGLCGGPALDRRWWLGWVAAIAALFSTAGGVLASIAALAVVLGSSIRQLRERRTLIGIVLLSGVVALGFASNADDPAHASLRARSVGQFLSVFGRCLAWPHVNQGVFAVIMQFPLLCLLLHHLRRREPLGRAARCALALVLFAWLHAAAVAYSRGGGLPEYRPLSRYQDPLLLGVAAQAFAGIDLAFAYRQSARIALLVWFAVLATGLISLTETNLSLNLPYKRAQDAASLAMIRAYAHSGNVSVFTQNPEFTGPHPDPAVVQRVLDTPRFRTVLPAPLLAANSTTAARIPGVFRYGALLTAIAASGLILLLVWLGCPRSPRVP